MFRSFRTFLTTLATSALLLATFAPEAVAQTTERSRWDQVTVGNSDVGLDVIGWARTRNPGSERRVDEAAWIQLRLLGANVELQRIAATAIRNGSSFSGSTTFRRGGFAVRSESFSTTATSAFTSSATVFGSNPCATFEIFGIPITVGANVGHTGVMNMQLQNWSTNGAMLTGSMDSYASGWASAAVGWPGLQVGIQVDIRIGHQRFDGVLSAFTGYLGTQFLNYSMTPIRLLLRLFLELGPITGSLTIVDAALGQRTLAPFLP